jgi:predicted unusual protein kinase regulating ubiquinone biosynthesis (AarF/ABC1/UbiB family)
VLRDVYCHVVSLTLDFYFVPAVLDWGMVTELDPKLRLTLIEHMAHLTSADYAEIPRDLLLLGFIPESKKDLIDDSGVVELLADIYGAWTKGK